MIKSFEDKPSQKMRTEVHKSSFARKMLELLIGDKRKSKPAMPRGLGGYTLRPIGVEILDPRQKTGVKVWRAMLIDRNRYKFVRSPKGHMTLTKSW